MLDLMRKNAQSWGIKILFGLIIVVFVFWGIGSFRSNKAAVIAEVNGRPIAAQDFRIAYERTLKSLRHRNPNISQKEIQQMRLKEQVLNQLINAELLREKAKALGVDITLPELRKAITSIPFFQNKNKKFDPNLYKKILKLNGLSPATFEKDYSENLLIEKMRAFITLPAKANLAEVYDMYKFAKEQIQIEYLLFKLDNYLNKIKISNNEIQKYYNENKDKFMDPEKIKIAYLLLTPENLAKQEKVSEQEIKEYYESHKNSFFQPERVKARHILIRLNPDASKKELKQAEQKIAKIEKELQKGKSFAELAKKYSECPSKKNGGEVGWFTKKDMVKPFADAAFALKVGEISKPVRTQFGLHLIKLEDKKAAGIPSLKEVKEQIKNTIAQEKAYAKIQDLLDSALTRLAAGESLQKIATELGLEVKTTNLFSRKNIPQDLKGLKPKDIQALFDLPVHETTKTPFNLQNGYLLVSKLEAISPKPLPLEKVKETIKTILTRQKAQKLALEEATKTLNKLQKKEKINISLKTSKPFTRQGFIPELGFNPSLAQEAFLGKVNTWLDKPYKVMAGYILAKPIKHIIPSKQDFAKEQEKWMQVYQNFKAKQLFSAFINSLHQKAEIKIINPRYLKY